MKANEIEIRFGKISKEEYDNLLNKKFNKEEETNTEEAEIVEETTK